MRIAARLPRAAARSIAREYLVVGNDKIKRGQGDVGRLVEALLGPAVRAGALNDADALDGDVDEDDRVDARQRLVFVQLHLEVGARGAGRQHLDDPRGPQNTDTSG